METFKKAMDVNVHGVLAGVKTMLPLIREAHGRVVTITSGLGRMAVPTRSPYVGTKYALEGILDCLRYEMRSFGVSVSILEPGNFIAGTNIFNENFVKSQANMMWDAMPQEVQSVYGREYFDKKVEVMRSYMNNGITDISPVIDAYTDALLDMFPQVFNLSINVTSSTLKPLIFTRPGISPWICISKSDVSLQLIFQSMFMKSFTLVKYKVTLCSIVSFST